MSLQLVPEVNYSGEEGVSQVRALHRDLDAALRAEDWQKLRRLDQCCARVVDKVIAANKNDCASLLLALSELKNLYVSLIEGCQQQAAVMAM